MKKNIADNAVKSKNTAIVLSSIIAAVLMTVCAGCDPFHYHPVTEDRTVPEFAGVALDGVGYVYINAGADENTSVSVTADIDVIDSVITAVNTANRVLSIDVNKNITRDNGSVYVSGGRMGEIYVDINARVKSAALNGTGDIVFSSGEADELYLFHIGNGSVRAQDYRVNVATVALTGKGDVRVWAADTLYVAISAGSTGEVLYRGDPAIVIITPKDIPDRKPVLEFEGPNIITNGISTASLIPPAIADNDTDNCWENCSVVTDGDINDRIRPLP